MGYKIAGSLKYKEIRLNGANHFWLALSDQQVKVKQNLI